MKIGDQIEALRQQMLADEHQNILSRAVELDRMLLDRDADLMRILNGILDGQCRRAADIQHALSAIRYRIGYAPPLQVAPPVVASPQPQRPRSPHQDDARAMAARYAPPMRPVSTSGDALDIYGNASGGEV